MTPGARSWCEEQLGEPLTTWWPRASPLERCALLLDLVQEVERRLIGAATLEQSDNLRAMLARANETLDRQLALSLGAEL